MTSSLVDRYRLHPGSRLCKPLNIHLVHLACYPFPYYEKHHPPKDYSAPCPPPSLQSSFTSTPSISACTTRHPFTSPTTLHRISRPASPTSFLSISSTNDLSTSQISPMQVPRLLHELPPKGISKSMPTQIIGDRQRLGRHPSQGSLDSIEQHHTGCYFSLSRFSS
jgi:hypothetical protein